MKKYISVTLTLILFLSGIVTSFSETTNDTDFLDVQVIDTGDSIITITTLKDDENERITITDSNCVNFIIKGTLNKKTGEAVFEEIPKAGSLQKPSVIVMPAEESTSQAKRTVNEHKRLLMITTFFFETANITAAANTLNLAFAHSAFIPFLANSKSLL